MRRVYNVFIWHNAVASDLGDKELFFFSAESVETCVFTLESRSPDYFLAVTACILKTIEQPCITYT